MYKIMYVFMPKGFYTNLKVNFVDLFIVLID